MVDPADHGVAGVAAMHLIRIDTTMADSDALISDLMAIDPDSRSDLTVSSDAGVDLLAAAASEANDGMQVAVNWVSGAEIFEDDSTTEAPTGPAGYTSDVFDWSYMRQGGTMDIDVVGTWQMLELAGKLGNRIEIAILDGGFILNNDTPAGSEAHSVVGGDALNRAGVGSSPWHGTNVAAAAAALHRQRLRCRRIRRTGRRSGVRLHHLRLLLLDRCGARRCRPRCKNPQYELPQPSACRRLLDRRTLQHRDRYGTGSRRPDVRGGRQRRPRCRCRGLFRRLLGRDVAHAVREHRRHLRGRCCRQFEEQAPQL